MITLAVENWQLICFGLLGGLFLGLSIKKIFAALGALLEFQEISERAKRDGEVIRRESEAVLPLARKMNERCSSLGGDMWLMENYNKMDGKVEELARECRRMSSEIERLKGR